MCILNYIYSYNLIIYIILSLYRCDTDKSKMPMLLKETLNITITYSYYSISDNGVLVKNLDLIIYIDTRRDYANYIII